MLGAGVLCFVLGSLVSASQGRLPHQPPFPAADGFYLSAYPLLLLGILFLPATPLTPFRRMRVALDGLIIIATAVIFSWYFTLGQVISGGADTWGARVVATTYPICDLVLLGCVLLAWSRTEERTRRRASGLLSLGLTVLVVADCLFDYQAFHGGHAPSGLIEAARPLGYTCIALGAAALRRVGVARPAILCLPSEDLGMSDAPRPADTPPLWLELAPYLLALAVGLLVARVFQHPMSSRLDNGVFAGGAVVALLVVLRQALILLENRKLYQRLHHAFIEQGQSLARRVAELEWLRTLSQRLNGAHTIDAVLDIVYEGVREGLGYDRVGFNLIDHGTGIFVDCMGTDDQGRQTKPMDRSLTLGSSSVIWRIPGFAAVLQGAECYCTADAAAECPPDLLYLYDGRPTHNLMVPIRSGNRVTGVISVDNLLSGLPICPKDAAPLLALAHHVGTAVENARLLEHEQAERVRLATMATTDALTTLPNRLLLHQRLAHAIEAAGHTDSFLALILMDLDRFKEVNDTLGHHAGDALLREVGARLRSVIRAADTVARLGGDEFSVVLPQTDVEGAIHVAFTLLRALEAPIVVEGQPLVIEASIGIAICPDHGTDVPVLLRHADVAMYVAKRSRSRYAVYSADTDQHSPARLTRVSALRQALAEGGLRLHYQPLVDLTSGRLLGVEALARWPHPVQGDIPPDQFIPLAEQSDVIVPLTRWVLETALAQAQTWRRQHGLQLSLSVNLSAHDPFLPQTVANLLRQYETSPRQLTLEITESALMADPSRTLDVLTRLSALGVRLAVDDFGTGYSSLAYLKQWPVHVLKIDKSFVLGLSSSRNPEDTAIVRAVVALAQALGLSVVAEGVETREAWDVLRALGCTVAQGYYVSRPLPGDDLASWAAREARRAS